MYDVFTDQRLAQVRQQELTALGQQSARNRWRERARPDRKIHVPSVVARLLVALNH